MKCKICGNEYPSKYYFKEEDICNECYPKISQKREGASAKGGVLIGCGFLPTQELLEAALNQGYIKNCEKITVFESKPDTNRMKATFLYMEIRYQQGWDDRGGIETSEMILSDGRKMWAVFPTERTIDESAEPRLSDILVETMRSAITVKQEESHQSVEKIDQFLQEFRKASKTLIAEDGSVSEENKGDDYKLAVNIVRACENLALLKPRCSADEYERILLLAHNYGLHGEQLSHAFGEIGTSRSIRRLIHGLYQDFYPREVNDSESALIATGKKAHAPLLSHLSEDRKGRDWWIPVRKTIINILAKTGDEECIRTIEAVMHSDPAVQVEAQAALSAIKGRLGKMNNIVEPKPSEDVLMNDSNIAVSRCKGCGRILTESQINMMNTQKDATAWVKEGYHSFVCYKQHHVTTEKMANKDQIDGDLLATMNESSLAGNIPQPALIKKYPDIPQDHLSTLIGFAFTSASEKESVAIPLLFTCCEMYQAGALFIQKHSSEYRLYKKSGVQIITEK